VTILCKTRGGKWSNGLQKRKSLLLQGKPQVKKDSLLTRQGEPVQGSTNRVEIIYCLMKSTTTNTSAINKSVRQLTAR